MVEKLLIVTLSTENHNILQHTQYVTIQLIGGFHLTSSQPCWWTRTLDSPLAPLFVHQHLSLEIGCNPPILRKAPLVLPTNKIKKSWNKKGCRKQSCARVESAHFLPCFIIVQSASDILRLMLTCSGSFTRIFTPDSFVVFLLFIISSFILWFRKCFRLIYFERFFFLISKTLSFNFSNEIFRFDFSNETLISKLVALIYVVWILIS